MPDPIPESELLLPRDPSTDESTDEWPELTLTDAYVHLPDDQTALASVLEAATAHRLTVVGYLEPLEDEDVELYRKPPKGKPQRVLLELDDVRMYSYGQLEDGSIRIWAAGKTGWYTIDPSKKYRSIYKTMCEAVKVLYFVSDAYREQRFEGRGKSKKELPAYSLRELFEKYAKEELEDDDVVRARAVIDSYKDFLISAMVAGKEGLHWSQYALYGHFYKKFPDTFALVRQRQQPVEEAKPVETKRSRNGSINTVPTTTNSDAAKPRRARKGSVETDSTITTSSRRKRANTSQAEAKPPRTISARQASAEARSNTNASTRRRGKAASMEVISLDGSSEATSPDVQMVPSNSMTPPRAKLAGRRTRQQPNAPASPVPEELATPGKDEESDEEIRAREQKNKSSLRPRASKASKSASRRGTTAPVIEDESDEEDDDAPPSSPIAGKRKYLDVDEEARPRRLKRRSSRPIDDEGIDIPTSPEAASSPDSSKDLPLRQSEAGHISDPVQEDTWVCALDGCTHKVYAASQPDSQRLIREHYALHAYDDDERVKMVKNLQAPSLPVAHLMERVKLQAKHEGFPASHAMPDQVRSRFGSVARTGILPRY